MGNASSYDLAGAKDWCRIFHKEGSLERYGDVLHHLQLAPMLRKRVIRENFPNQCTDSSLAVSNRVITELLGSGEWLTSLKLHLIQSQN